MSTKISNAAVVLGCALMTAACGGVKYDYGKEPDPRKKEYVIGVSDALKVNVWRSNELSTTGVVRPDGTITMPLIGDIKAAGRTPSQLTDEIGLRLKTFVKEETANVSVSVEQVNSYRFTVSGNVERAGVHTERYYVTVADAIALSGGLNKFAAQKKILILRLLPNGGLRKIPINFDRISTGEHPEENLVLLAGDTVFVP